MATLGLSRSRSTRALETISLALLKITASLGERRKCANEKRKVHFTGRVPFAQHLDFHSACMLRTTSPLFSGAPLSLPRCSARVLSELVLLLGGDSQWRFSRVRNPGANFWYLERQ